MQDFQGKVAVITGGASGFGREFARTAAGLGMKLVLADIEATALEATAAELRAQGAQVLTRVLGQALAHLAPRARHAVGRADQALALGVLTDRDE